MPRTIFVSDRSTDGKIKTLWLGRELGGNVSPHGSLRKQTQCFGSCSLEYFLVNGMVMKKSSLCESCSMMKDVIRYSVPG